MMITVQATCSNSASGYMRYRASSQLPPLFDATFRRILVRPGLVHHTVNSGFPEMPQWPWPEDEEPQWPEDDDDV